MVSYMVKYDPLGQTTNPLTDDMREALLRTNAAKQCIQELFQKLSEHVQIFETEKEGFQKVVLALIRRMLEDIFEAICKPAVWKAKCCWLLKQLPVQTLEIYDMLGEEDGSKRSVVALLWIFRQERDSYWKMMQEYIGSDVTSMVTLLS
ncbi:hypothetical protein Droror1_Dr00018960 [Drosera rotundifolia]